MREVVLLKGKHEIISLPGNSDKAEMFYDFLIGLFEERGFVVRIVDSVPDYDVNDRISENTVYVIGHSRGANKILKELDLDSEIKGVVLFDPWAKLRDDWEGLNVKKVLFTSDWGQDYSSFGGDVVRLRDDHYFNESFVEIKEKINGFIK